MNVKSEDNKALEVLNLAKKYTKNANYAIKNVSFTAERGEIIGLLGANGAGKSTLLKCVTGMLDISDGEVSICGYSMKNSPINAKSHLSFVTDNHAVFQKLTGRQYLSFMFDVFKIPEAEREGIVCKLDDYFQLGADIDRIIANYSHGMKQKICMMGSLVHSPDLWILDEPMVGLDPRTQASVIDFMKDYVKRGKTILFSSHYLDCVKKVCDRAIIISKGVVAADMSIADCGDEVDSLYNYTDA